MTYRLTDLFSQWYQARRFVICETSGDISGDLRNLYRDAHIFAATLGLPLPTQVHNDEAETECLR